jgi:uncharacterized membrane protein YhaH (DUF805 family)
MTSFFSKERAFFLFRADQGRIDAKTWRQGTAMLVAILAVLTAIWLVVSPFAQRDLASTAFFAWATLATFVYLLVYAFAILLIAVSHYNLSAKRWRDRGRPAGLAGLLPFFALLSGAAHWLQPRVPEDVSSLYVVGIDVLLAGIIVWNGVELGLCRGRAP